MKKDFASNIARAGRLKNRLIELAHDEGRIIYYNLLGGYGYEHFNEIRNVKKQLEVIEDIIKLGKAMSSQKTEVKA